MDNPHPLRKYVSEVFQGSLLKQAASRTRNRPASGNRQQVIMGIRLAKTKEKRSAELTLLHQNTVAEKISNSIQMGRSIISNERQTGFDGFF